MGVGHTPLSHGGHCHLSAHHLVRSKQTGLLLEGVSVVCMRGRCGMALRLTVYSCVDAELAVFSLRVLCDEAVRDLQVYVVCISGLHFCVFGRQTRRNIEIMNKTWVKFELPTASQKLLQGS